MPPLEPQPGAEARRAPVRAGDALLPFGTRDLASDTARRFEETASRFPDSVAIRDHCGEMTYRRLNEATNRLAHAIVKAGIEPPGPVAIMLGQRAASVVSQLAVLKTGAAYVMLDRDWPAARLSFMISDSRASLLLANPETLNAAQELAQRRCPVLDVESLDPSLPAQNLSLPVSPDDVAYLTYTSGTSGQPKGVMLTHRARLHNTRNFSWFLHLKPGDRFALVHAISSGASSGDIYAPLLTGGTLCIYDLGRFGLGEIGSWLVGERVNILHWLPTALRHFLAILPEGQIFPDLRVVISGSETLSTADVASMRERFGDDCLLVNRYGVTEGGNVAMFSIGQGLRWPGHVVPVGYELEGCRVVLLDEAGQPVRDGEVGEIGIQGASLAKGYWRQPDLTRARFVPSPDGSGDRTYLSGDLGRFLPGRCLVHLGRADSQVKVRGYRVELAEVEMALMAHPSIRETAVVAQGGPSGDCRLVAHIATGKFAKPTVGELRRFLAERLPEYMIPSAFQQHDALPLNAGGKADRLALASPMWGHPERDAGHVAPRNSLEASLTAIWAHVLDMDKADIGVHDPFAELGGHSLHAVQTLARVRDAFRVGLTPEAFFAAPTIAQQAVAIAQAAPSERLPRVVPRRPGSDAAVGVANKEE